MECSPDDLCSHPNKRLADHLNEVGTTASSLISGSRPELSDPAYIAGAYHDVGKYTTFFQKHLRGGKDPRSSHAEISSLIAYYVAKRALSSLELPILVSLAVRSHHGHLKGIETVKRWAMNKLDDPGVLGPQFQDLYKRMDRILENMSNIRYHSHVEGFLEQDLNSTLEEYASDLLHLEEELKADQSKAWERYLGGLLLFSCLIDSDKHSASDTSFLPQNPPSPSLITEFISSIKSNDRMAGIREKLNSLVSSTPVSRTVTLIAPSGSGKTLSGVLTALKMGKSRLIYALPYISIVEQVHDVLSRTRMDPLKFYHLY